MRPTSGAAKAKPATEQPGRTPSLWRQPKGGGSRRPPTATGFGQVLRARRARPPLGRRPQNQVPHTTVGLLVRLVRRLAVPRGRQVRHFSFLGLWDHSSRLQWSHDRRQTHVGNSPGNSSHTPPDLQALERGRRHFGACGGHSQDGASPYCRSGQAFGGRPPGTRSAALQGQVQSPHRWPGQAQACPTAAAGGARDRREQLGTQRGGRFAAGQAAAGTRCQGPLGEGIEAHEAGRAAPQGRGTHWQANPHWLQCRGALGFRGFGLHSNTAPIHQSRRGQSHIPAQPRAKRCHNDAGQRPGSGGQKHRPGFATSPTGHHGLGDGSLGRHPRPRHHAGRAARLTGQARSSQAAVVRRYGRSGYFRAYALAPGLECAVSEAPHDPRRHQDRPPGSRAQNGGLLGGPGIPSVVRQLCTLESVQGPAVLGSHQATPHFWQIGRLVTLGTTAAASCATMDQAQRSTVATNARPCRQKGICTSHRRCARLHARWIPNTGSSLHAASFRTLAPFCQQVFLNASARSSGTIGPRWAFGGAHFTDGSSWRHRCVAPRTLGSGGGRRCGKPQGSSLRACRATFCLGSLPEMAKITQRPWRGSSPWIRSRSTSTAKVPSRQSMGQSTKPWEPRPPPLPRAHVWNRLLFSTTRSGQSRSRVMRQSAMWRLGALPDTFANKGADTHTSLLFESPRQSLPVLPWPSKRHVGRPKRTFCSGSGGGMTPGLLCHDHGDGPRERDSSERRRRTMLRRLQVRFLTGFLPSSPYVSRKTVTSTLALSEGTARNWDAFRCGRPSFGQRHHLLRQVWSCILGACGRSCRQCSEFPGGRTSQLRKLRSGLFPNKRYPGWTVEHVRRPTLDEAATFGGRAGILRGWLGSHGHRAHHTQKATGGPSGSGACTLGKSRRGCRQRKPRAAAVRPTAVEVVGGVWTQRSVGVKARPQDFGVLCAVGCDGSSSSESEAEPYNIWNELLAALVHFRTGEVLQPLLTSEEVGCVALSCHLACDALCAELYDWEAAELG